MPQISVGNVTVLPIQDTAILMNPRQFMPDHAEEWMAESGDEADERGLMPMSVTCYLVRSAGKNVLVDTGLGNRRRPGFPRGRLDVALQEAGVAPGDIDLIVHTHLHIDHVGWNTVQAEDGTSTIFFPNARWLIQRVEWDYWMQPKFTGAEGNAHLVECVAPLTDTGRIDFVYAEQAIDENLVFVGAPGHTPGHVGVGIQSAGEKAIIVGDASHHPVQLTHPDWSPGFDCDPTLSARTRERLFDEAASDGRTWIAGHWQFPGMGHVVRVEGRRTFRAL